MQTIRSKNGKFTIGKNRLMSEGTLSRRLEQPKPKVFQITGQHQGYWIQTANGHYRFSTIEECTEQMTNLEAALQAMREAGRIETKQYNDMCAEWDAMKVAKDEFRALAA